VATRCFNSVIVALIILSKVYKTKELLGGDPKGGRRNIIIIVKRLK